MDPFREVQHCTDLSCQVTFSVHTELEKIGQGWDERYDSTREGEQ